MKVLYLIILAVLPMLLQAKSDTLPPPPPPPTPSGDSITDIHEAPEVFSEDPAEQTFSIVEKMPVFPGGESAMYKYLSKMPYPEMARDAGIQGKVFARFVVDRDGTINDVNIIRGLHTSLDSVVVSHLEAMPKWEPGTQRDKPVKVSFTLPVSFTLK